MFAVPLWRRRLTTLADLFRIRYSTGVERVAVLLMVPASVLWAAAQIRAFGQVLSASSDLSITATITIAAAAVIVYTVSGGLLADAITDLIQGVALIGGLLVLLPVVIQSAGGVEAAFAAITPERLRIFGGSIASIPKVLEAWAVPICGSVISQELAARVLAVRSPEIARQSSLLAGSIYLLVGLIPAFIGLVGATLLPDLEHPEQILPLLAQRHLSVLGYTVFAGALVSAILSTVDSALLAASSLVSQNLLVSAYPGMSEATKVWVARLGVVVCGGLAYLLALHAEGVYALVEDASAFGGAGIFIIVVFGLFTQLGGARSALAALVAGMAVWLYGTYIAGFTVVYLASLLAALLAYLAAAGIEQLLPAKEEFSAPTAAGEKEE
ncbi:MAG: sodium:solute symporter [Candidatus Binatia bacterium]|nr:sodium:solute symporter [Candidatus Binatia bacterium]